MKKTLKNSRGFSLLEVMIVAGIMGVMSLGLSELILHFIKAQKTMELKMSLSDVKSSLKATLVNEASWRKTVGAIKNDSLSCLRTYPSDCSSRISTHDAFSNPITEIRSTNDSVIYQNLQFSKNGVNPCVVGGDPECFFEVQLNWIPVPGTCAAGDCTNPDVELSAKFIYLPGAGNNVVNVGRYDFILRKPGTTSIKTVFDACESIGGTLNTADGTLYGTCEFPPPDYTEVLNASCTSLGGTFDTTTKECKLPSNATVSCGPDEYVAGINSDDTPICKAIDNTQSVAESCLSVGGTFNATTKTCTMPQPPAASCLADQYMAGLNADGTPYCKPLPKGSCPAGQFQTGIKADGSPKCSNMSAAIGNCGSGNFLQGIKSDGTSICKPDQNDGAGTASSAGCMASAGGVKSCWGGASVGCGFGGATESCPAGTTVNGGMSCDRTDKYYSGGFICN